MKARKMQEGETSESGVPMARRFLRIKNNIFRPRSPRKTPFGKVAQQAAQLPQKGLQAAVRRAVPCMDGGVLGHQIRFAPGAHLLG